MTKLSFDKFKPELNDAELDVQVNKPKFLKPGTYDLKVVGAELHKAQNATDPTWAQFKLTLASVDGRTINTIVLVPTTSMKFNKPGSKNPYFMFHKYQEVVKAFGEDASVEVFAKTAGKLFGEVEKLIGRSLSVVVGYPGYYVERGEDEKYRIYEKGGKLFQPEGKSLAYPDRDSAIAGAAEFNIQVKKFVEIMKFLPAEVSVEAGEVDDSDPWS